MPQGNLPGVLREIDQRGPWRNPEDRDAPDQGQIKENAANSMFGTSLLHFIS
ncbi:hypothetical protein [Massilia sp. 9096]|uniref:hypothetical protein n=1 Tax=Massilia sp. 9096 TaxID=1500894 RepID=UPI000A54BA62|nr:hypothetical protein [Massilia sp. 9096]